MRVLMYYVLTIWSAQFFFFFFLAQGFVLDLFFFPSFKFVILGETLCE